jgi:hypothetical protein
MTKSREKQGETIYLTELVKFVIVSLVVDRIEEVPSPSSERQVDGDKEHEVVHERKIRSASGL